MDRFSQRAKSKPNVKLYSFLTKIYIILLFPVKKEVFFKEFFINYILATKKSELILINIILWHFYDSFDHTLYSVKPKHRISGQHPSMNDDLPLRLASGSVKMKPNIKRFTESHVEFEDGSIVTNVDVVVLATGWLLVGASKNIKTILTRPLTFGRM